VSIGISRQSIPHQRHNLGYTDESSPFLLGENHVPTHSDVEDPMIALDQLRYYANLTLQSGRQPGGPVIVVSRHTIGDGYRHMNAPF